MVYSQKEPFEYLGVIKLNDTSFISYKLAFEELDGKIEGFSIADMGGKHETKSNISGEYDADEKLLRFRESDIVYTKSPIGEVDMCLVNFEGKMRNLEKAKAFSGEFKGTYPDSTACLDGMVIMSASESVMKRIERIDKKIQKSKQVTQEVKDKISAKRTLDTLTMSIVKKDENLNVFVKSKKVVVSIYDSGKVDDDRVNLYVNDELILEDYSITRARREIPITLVQDIAQVRVEALNEGSSAPNTVKVEIKDGVNLISTRTSLNIGDRASISLRVQ